MTESSVAECPERRATVSQATIIRDPHPSRALWAPTTADGKSLLDAAGLEAMHICSSVPPDCARRLQSMIYSGAAHPWQTKGDGDTALHLAVFSGNEQVGSPVAQPSITQFPHSTVHSTNGVSLYAAGKYITTCWSLLQCLQPKRTDSAASSSAGALIVDIVTND